MTNNSCPHCERKERETIYSIAFFNKPIAIVQCLKCHHVYTWYDVEIAEKDLYKMQAYTMDDQTQSIFFKIQQFEYRQVLKKIIKLLPGSDLSDNNLLLDFGCGKGHFPFFANQIGFKSVGIETAPERAAFAREKYNLKITTDFYNGLGKIHENCYDVITMFHVAEHLPQPEVIVKGLMEFNLKTSGIMVIEVPNFHSLQSKIGKKRWLHLDVPRHLNHYSPQFLRSFFIKNGFKVLKQETFSWHVGIIGMLQALMSIFGYKNSLVEDLKFNRTFKLVITVCLLIIPAVVLEFISSMFGKGGMIRLYIRK
jgi:2-polyprenyl-3-methyl-5-hydroxy-6-metoxy-1,4-benzoquinol methylase